MKTSRLPFYLIIGFNIFTWIIYLSNPFVEEKTDNHVITLLYILVNIIFLVQGYKKGEKVGEKLHLRKIGSTFSFVTNYLSAYIVFYLLTFTLKYAYDLRCPAFNLPVLINRIVLGIANPEWGYLRTLEGSQSFPWSLYTIINMADCVFFIVGMLCWPQMKKWQKRVFVVLILFELLKWLGAGTSFGIVQISMTLVLVFCLSMKSTIISKKRMISILMVVLGAFFGVLVLFGINMQGRAGGSFVDLASTKVNLNSFVYVYFVSYLPEWFQNLYQYIANYLVGGYYHLELALSCDFDWCYFLGSNDAKTHLFNIITGFDVEPLNYQTKVYKIFYVDPYIYWHSCYTWIANDVSFYGVPIVMYYVSKFCSVALSLFRRYNDLLSGMVFVFFGNMIILLFANNNYIANIFYSFIIIFPYWLFTRYFRFVK